MHPEWLSNAYLIADERGGTAVFVDSGAPLGPLHEAVEDRGVKHRVAPAAAGSRSRHLFFSGSPNA